MICQKLILMATGCALANIPLVILSDEEFSSINDGMKLSINTDSNHPLQYQ